VRIQGVVQDGADFAVFYEQSRDACLRAVMATVADQEAAEELVAEAFARAWARWRQVSCHPAPRAWVVRTALNIRVSWWRRRRREVDWAAQDQAAVDEPDPPLDDRVLASLRRLPARQREVVALRVLLDLDTETTAGVLRIAPGTVTAHMSRALATLRLELRGPANYSSTMEVNR
jgi:RNA polymerase sigma factor (sigma-70 family)